MEPPIELMYRPPGRDTHINIVEAFNELYKRVNELEDQLLKLQKDTE